VNAINRVIEQYGERNEDFWDELQDYLTWGIVYSGHGMFLMYKAVNSSEDPTNQWGVKDPDAWYVRWAAGDGCIKYMLRMLVPELPKLIFFRNKKGKDMPNKIYDMKKFCRKVGV
jgi:hypothetical protein